MTEQFLLHHAADRPRIIGTITKFMETLSCESSWMVEIKPHVKTRTTLQNRSLWGVAYATLAKATKNDPEDLHRYFLGEKFGWKTINVMGQQRRVPLRTSSAMTPQEFNDFYTFIQQRSAEAGYYVPDPKESIDENIT